MTIFAYIRVSDSAKQTAKNQEFMIKEYAKKNNLLLDSKNIFTHKISGSKSTQEQRGWGEVLSAIDEGDTLLVSDVDRLGRERSTGIIALIDAIIIKGVKLVFCHSNTVFDVDCHNDPGKFFMLMGKAYAAVEFAKERSRKAKAAADIRSSSKLHNGRMENEFVSSKLDEKEGEIIIAISNNESKTSLAKRLGASRSQLYKWIKKRDEVMKEANKKEIETNGKSIGEIKKELRHYLRKNPAS